MKENTEDWKKLGKEDTNRMKKENKEERMRKMDERRRKYGKKLTRMKETRAEKKVEDLRLKISFEAQEIKINIKTSYRNKNGDLRNPELLRKKEVKAVRKKRKPEDQKSIEEYCRREGEKMKKNLEENQKEREKLGKIWKKTLKILKKLNPEENWNEEAVKEVKAIVTIAVKRKADEDEDITSNKKIRSLRYEENSEIPKVPPNRDFNCLRSPIPEKKLRRCEQLTLSWMSSQSAPSSHVGCEGTLVHLDQPEENILAPKLVTRSCDCSSQSWDQSQISPDQSEPATRFHTNPDQLKK